MSTDLEWTGTFWSVDDGRKSQGKLSRAQRRFTLKLESEVVSSITRVTTMLNGTTMTTVSADPALVVVDFEPRSILGELTDGSLITFLDAHLDQGMFHQSFTGHRVVWGGHLPADPEFVSVRFVPPSWQLWAGLVGSATCDDSKPVGRLSGEVQDDQLWIEFASEVRMSLSSLESLVWHSAVTFMRLWCNAPLRLQRVEIRPSSESPWLRLETTGLSKGKQEPIHDPLLAPADMSVEMLGRWLTLAAEISPVHFMVAPGRSTGASIQTQVLTLASALEGLHRRTHSNQNLFHRLSPAEVKSVRLASVEAAMARLTELGFTDLSRAEEGIRMSLNHIGQVTLAERLLPLAKEAEDVAPGLIGPSVAGWVQGVKGARNDEGHQLETAPEFGAQKLDPYYQYMVSARWVAHIALLTLMAVDKVVLRMALLRHTSFLFDLANIDTCQHGWGGSSLATFRDACATPIPEVGQ